MVVGNNSVEDGLKTCFEPEMFEGDKYECEKCAGIGLQCEEGRKADNSPVKHSARPQLAS